MIGSPNISNGKYHHKTDLSPLDVSLPDMIQTVEARSGSEIKVAPKDGTEHSIAIMGLADGDKPVVTFRESKAGKVVAEESS